ncbi:MAG: hypothetical protein ACE5G0_13625 [Rhodothermales bacterium]
MKQTVISFLFACLCTTALAQTTEQAEESIFYLKQRACAKPVTGGWTYAPDPASPQACVSDLGCSDPLASCRHRSFVEPASLFYAPLEFAAAPKGSGQGEGFLRYVPLCEDGSGDHEYAVSEGILGTPPTCAADVYIRCANGVRPLYRADAGQDNNWLIHAGGGGHANAPTSH